MIEIDPHFGKAEADEAPDFDCFAAQNRLSVRNSGKRFCRLSQNAIGLVNAGIVVCELQRSYLDIRSLFGTITDRTTVRRVLIHRRSQSHLKSTSFSILGT